LYIQNFWGNLHESYFDRVELKGNTQESPYIGFVGNTKKRGVGFLSIVVDDTEGEINHNSMGDATWLIGILIFGWVLI
jgi:hypothetical protein